MKNVDKLLAGLVKQKKPTGSAADLGHMVGIVNRKEIEATYVLVGGFLMYN